MKLLTLITIFLAFTSSCAATRRRRRNRYNDRPCGPGQYAVLSSGKNIVINCESCPTGTYRPDEKHSMEACIGCEAGRVSSTDFTHCVGDICRAGTYGTSDSTICKSCEVGKYSVVGQFTCTQCESGRYNNAVKQGSCVGEKCSGGKYGLIGQTEKSHTTCSECPAGKWSSGATSSCEVCPVGKYSFDNADTCTTHDTCSSYMYYDVLPSTTSIKTSCATCMYYSVIYSVGYFFACIVIVMNAILFMYNRAAYGYVMIMIIVASSWLLALTFCKGNPRDSVAIVSIIMNTFCFIPGVHVMITAIKKYYTEHNDKQKTTTTVTKNKMGRDMVAV